MKIKRFASHTLSDKEGFTLIEILIAVAIFSIGILAIGSMQLWSVKNNTTGNITTQASMLAKAKIEELKNTGDVTTLTNGADTDSIFTRQWQITNPLGDNESRQIEVTVSWNRRGQNRSVVLTTITKGNGT